jgi:hypothetical protein
MYCIIKCVKSTRVLKGKFASPVFHSCKEKTPKMRILVSGPQCVKTIGTWRWQGCQPNASAAFTPRKYSWYSFMLEADPRAIVRPEGCRWKIPTPSRINPAAFGFVAQASTVAPPRAPCQTQHQLKFLTFTAVSVQFSKMYSFVQDSILVLTLWSSSRIKQ